MARKSKLSAGLSAAQTFVLSAIADRPNASVNDIAIATMTDRSSTAAVFERLFQQGYVVRRASMKRVSTPLPTAALIRGVGQLSRADRRALDLGLVDLERAMGVDEEPAGMLFEDAPAKKKRVRSRGHHAA